MPAAIEQARVAANVVAGENDKYMGTIGLNTLKVGGIFLTSIGEVHPKEGDVDVAFSHGQVYKKIMLRNDKPVGAIWLGEVAKAKALSDLIRREQKLSKEDAKKIAAGELNPSSII